MAAMNILLTGANGFIGAWTLRRLLERGHSVTALDLEAPGALVHRLAGSALQRVDWRRGDVAQRQDVDAAAAGCDSFVHLAGVLTPFCQQDPVRGAMINLIGTLHVFEAARRTASRRVVFTSSAGVYGPEQARHPEPTTHYGAFKLATEGCARSYWHDHAVASIGLRPFVFYGPGREVGGSAGISLACRAAVQGRSFTIPFTGRAGMVYVEDVVDAIAAGLEQPLAGAHVLNLVGEVCDVQEVIDQIRVHYPAAELSAKGDALPLLADIPPGDSVLKGLRVTPLRDGIARTLAFAL